jgi:hypothetical protein
VLESIVSRPKYAKPPVSGFVRYGPQPAVTYRRVGENVQKTLGQSQANLS